MSELGLAVLAWGTPVAVALAIARLLRGPTQADRIVAQDVLFAGGVAVCLFAALATRRTVFLDVALGLALTGFVATLCWARVLARSGEGEREP